MRVIPIGVIPKIFVPRISHMDKGMMQVHYIQEILAGIKKNTHPIHIHSDWEVDTSDQKINICSSVCKS